MKKLMNKGRGRKKQKFWIILLLCYSIISSSAQNPTFDSLANEINRISLFKKAKSHEMLDTLYQMAYNSTDSSELIARCIYEESVFKQGYGFIDTMLTKKINNRLERKYHSLYEYALLQSALMANLYSQKKYAESFSILLEVLEKYKQLNNNRFISKTLNYMGIICSDIDLNELSEYYYREALKYITPEYHEYYFIKNNLLLKSHNKEDAIIDSMLFLIKLAEKEYGDEILPLFYVNLIFYYLETYPEKAFIYFEKIHSLGLDNPVGMAILYAHIGSYYSYMNNFYESLLNFKNAQNIMENNNDLSNLSIVYYQISSLFESQNMYDSALIYARKHEELIQQLRSNTIAIETHQKYITTMLESAQKDLTIAKQKFTIRTFQTITISVISILIIIVVVRFLIIINRQKKIQILENSGLKTKLVEEEKKLKYQEKQRKIEKEKQKMVIENKDREISSYSLFVTGINDNLKQIQDLTANVSNNKEDAVKTTSKIKDIIKNNLNIDKEWDNFIMHFEKVHPNFFKKLKKINNHLTEENLKMCSYIKMGLTTKQISQIINVSEKSARMNKHRLKEKLKLTKDDKLDDFIANI